MRLAKQPMSFTCQTDRTKKVLKSSGRFDRLLQPGFSWRVAPGEKWIWICSIRHCHKRLNQATIMRLRPRAPRNGRKSHDSNTLTVPFNVRILSCAYQGCSGKDPKGCRGAHTAKGKQHWNATMTNPTLTEIQAIYWSRG
jgi:hypothetical protein